MCVPKVANNIGFGSLQGGKLAMEVKLPFERNYGLTKKSWETSLPDYLLFHYKLTAPLKKLGGGRMMCGFRF